MSYLKIEDRVKVDGSDSTWVVKDLIHGIENSEDNNKFTVTYRLYNETYDSWLTINGKYVHPDYPEKDDIISIKSDYNCWEVVDRAKVTENAPGIGEYEYYLYTVKLSDTCIPDTIKVPEWVIERYLK